MKTKTNKVNIALPIAAIVCALAVDAFAAKLVTDGEPTELFSGVSVDSGEVYALDADKSAATSNLVVTVESVAEFASFADPRELDDNAGSDYIGAIAATTNASGVAIWKASDGSDWVELLDHTPTTNTEYVVKTELDLGSKKLRHSVKASGADDFTVLRTVLGDWLSATTNKPALTSVQACGNFDTATLSGRSPASSDIDVDGAGSIAFEPSALEGIDITGDTDAITSALNTDGANGIKNWQNYVLGLSTTEASAKPYTAPVQNADPEQLTFSLGGVSVNERSGATVKYAVGAADSPSADFTSYSWSEWSKPDKEVPMKVPSGVKYYRVKIRIDTP